MQSHFAWCGVDQIGAHQCEHCTPHIDRYGPGFDARSRLTGWSMTKSVGQALVGVRVQDGAMSLAQPVLRQWAQAPQDPRRNITIDHCLRMSSGLEFDERYTLIPRDPPIMLTTEPSCAR